MNFRVNENYKREWKMFLHGCNCKMINGAAYHRHIVQTQMEQRKIVAPHCVDYGTALDTSQRDRKVNRPLCDAYKWLFLCYQSLIKVFVIRLPNLFQISPKVSFLAAFGDS